MHSPIVTQALPCPWFHTYILSILNTNPSSQQHTPSQHHHTLSIPIHPLSNTTTPSPLNTNPPSPLNTTNPLPLLSTGAVQSRCHRRAHDHNPTRTPRGLRVVLVQPPTHRLSTEYLLFYFGRHVDRCIHCGNAGA